MENNEIVNGIYSINSKGNKLKELEIFLKNLLNIHDYKKDKLSEIDYIDYLKSTSYNIEEEIKKTIDFYQYNEADISEIEEAKELCKELAILLSELKSELLNFGINESEYLSFKTEYKKMLNFYKGIANSLSCDETKNKTILSNYKEIEKEFLEFIKIIYK